MVDRYNRSVKLTSEQEQLAKAFVHFGLDGYFKESDPLLACLYALKKGASENSYEADFAAVDWEETAILLERISQFIKVDLLKKLNLGQKNPPVPEEMVWIREYYKTYPEKLSNCSKGERKLSEIGFRIQAKEHIQELVTHNFTSQQTQGGKRAGRLLRAELSFHNRFTLSFNIPANHLLTVI